MALIQQFQEVTTMFSLFRRKKRAPKRKCPALFNCKPNLELLEDRCLPSGGNLLVNGSFELGNFNPNSDGWVTKSA